MKTRVFFYSAAVFMALSLVFQFPSHSQFQTDSSINYFTITEYYDAYFDSLIQIKGAENMQGTGYKDYMRWKRFYSNRHGADGDLGAIWRGIQDYHENLTPPENYNDISDWRFVGPLGIPLGHNNSSRQGTGKGMMLSLWVDEGDHDLIYAGSHHSGLWKTVDNGENWLPLHDSDPRINGVNSIAVNPGDHDIIYITANNSLAEVSNYSSGLFKSTDGGGSWSEIVVSTPNVYPSASYADEVRKVYLHPHDSNIVYFVNMRNVYRSYNRSQTWQNIFHKDYFPWEDTNSTNFDYHNGLYDLKVAPWNDSLIFLAGSEILTMLQDSGQIHLSNISDLMLHAGLSPSDTLCQPPFRSAISVHDNYPGIAWFCYAARYKMHGTSDTVTYMRIVKYDYYNDSCEMIYQYIDSFANKFKLTFAASPSDDSVFYIGSVYLKKLDVNIGAGFGLHSSGYPDPCWMHVDMRDMQMFSDGLEHDTLYLANDAGISWGTDFEPPQQCDTNAWHWRHVCTSMENGLNVTEFYGLGISESSPYLLAGGCQDLNNMMLNQDSWINFGAGDGSDVVFDPNSPDIVYFYDWMNGGPYYRSDDLGATDSVFYRCGNSYVMTPMVLDPRDASILYSGNKSLLKFTGVNDFENTVPHPDTMFTFEHGLTDIEVLEYDQNSNIFYVSTNKAYHSWESSLPDPEEYNSCIFKSSNGTTFIDITSGLAGCLDGHITDIEANPDNTAQLWVAFGKFSKSSQDGKVFTSTDAGAHWSDCSHGLPEGLPVYKVEYLAGRERLIACTDVGIFKKDASDTIWFPFSNNLPLKIFTDLEVNEPHHKLVVSSFGRGIWETALDCQPNKYVQVITEDTLWNQDMVLDHEVAIDSNATLTIQNCRVAFPSEAKIVVRRGGNLVLDSAYLTTFCLEPWGGIEVWGNDDFSQFQAQHFGRVDIKNNSIVENAVTAILTGRSDLGIPTNEYNGGIFSIKDATFRNNQTAIEVLPYTNFHPDYGFEMPYFGKIANSVFVTDQAKYQDYPFKQFLKLTQVYGIDIKGSDFSNELTKTVAYPDRGKGIYTFNAHFYIDDYCLNPQIQPCQERKHSTFYGLEYGIRSLSDGSRRACSVKNAEFDHNRRGIYLNALESPILLNNNFDIFPLDESMGDTLYGIYLDHCTDYQIENNNFQSNSIPSGVGEIPKIGLVVNNSGVSYNEIYNNIFDSLLVGVSAIDTNRDENGRGLQILCNDFTVCRYDIAVMKSNEWARDVGIADNQGSIGTLPTSPANNTFSWISLTASDYYNECDNLIYWYPWDTITAHTIPKNYSIPLVDPLINPNYPAQFDKEVMCPISDDEPGRGDRIVIETLKMSVAEDQIDSIQNLLNLLIDGGSTLNLANAILNSNPNDSLELRDVLLDKSPYLSDSVMLTSIGQEDVLTPGILTEIFTANPHSAKSDTVQKALDQRLPPLSEDQRIDIDQGWFIAGAKESLESELSHYKADRSRAFHNIIRTYQYDTLTINPADSIIAWLVQEIPLQYRYQLVNQYLTKGDTTAAKNILLAIPSDYSLSTLQTSYHQAYQEYVNWKISSIGHHNSIYQLDSSDYALLFSLYDNSSLLLKSYLQNILAYIDSLEIKEKFILPEDGLKSNMIRRLPVRQSTVENSLIVYPNPASSYFLINYSLTELNPGASIQLTNVTGKLMKIININSIKDSRVVSLDNIPNGIYILNLYDGKNFKKSQKTVVIK